MAIIKGEYQRRVVFLAEKKELFRRVNTCLLFNHCLAVTVLNYLLEKRKVGQSILTVFIGRVLNTPRAPRFTYTECCSIRIEQGYKAAGVIGKGFQQGVGEVVEDKTQVMGFRHPGGGVQQQ